MCCKFQFPTNIAAVKFLRMLTPKSYVLNEQKEDIKICMATNCSHRKEYFRDFFLRISMSIITITATVHLIEMTSGNFNLLGICTSGNHA
jgi:hypothetical protein